jgi:hypothetical protein
MSFVRAGQPPAPIPAQAPRSIPVPFLSQSTPLGDALKRLTGAFGVQPCAPCQQRAQDLNARYMLTPWGLR